MIRAKMFVQKIEHGAILLEMLTAQGLTARLVTGQTSKDDRHALVRDLNAGKVDFAVASKVFNEGVNIVGLRTSVNAAGGKSAIDNLQRLGRATRRMEGKETCDMVDIFDLGVSSLETHARARRAAYLREGYKITNDPVHSRRK